MDGTAFILPIYIQLHSIYPNKGDSFEKAFVHRKDLRHIFSENTGNSMRIIRLYLDGLDEVAEIYRQQEIMLLAWQAFLKDVKPFRCYYHYRFVH